jgi:hypothetical protein
VTAVPAHDVQEDVAGFEISVDHVARVNVLDSFEELVHDVLLMDVLQDALFDDVVQVGLHVLEAEVDVAVVGGSTTIHKNKFLRRGWAEPGFVRRVHALAIT